MKSVKPWSPDIWQEVSVSHSGKCLSHSRSRIGVMSILSTAMIIILHYTKSDLTPARLPLSLLYKNAKGVVKTAKWWCIPMIFEISVTSLKLWRQSENIENILQTNLNLSCKYFDCLSVSSQQCCVREIVSHWLMLIFNFGENIKCVLRSGGAEWGTDVTWRYVAQVTPPPSAECIKHSPGTFL